MQQLKQFVQRKLPTWWGKCSWYGFIPTTEMQNNVFSDLKKCSATFTQLLCKMCISWHSTDLPIPIPCLFHIFQDFQICGHPAGNVTGVSQTRSRNFQDVLFLNMKGTAHANVPLKDVTYNSYWKHMVKHCCTRATFLFSNSLCSYTEHFIHRNVVTHYNSTQHCRQHSRKSNQTSVRPQLINCKITDIVSCSNKWSAVSICLHKELPECT